MHILWANPHFLFKLFSSAPQWPALSLSLSYSPLYSFDFLFSKIEILCIISISFYRIIHQFQTDVINIRQAWIFVISLAFSAQHMGPFLGRRIQPVEDNTSGNAHSFLLNLNNRIQLDCIPSKGGGYMLSVKCANCLVSSPALCPAPMSLFLRAWQ